MDKVLTNKERANLVWESTPYSQEPLKAPKIKIPVLGIFKWLALVALFPFVIPLMVLAAVTHKALTKRTNKY